MLSYRKQIPLFIQDGSVVFMTLWQSLCIMAGYTLPNFTVCLSSSAKVKDWIHKQNMELI